MNIWWLPSQCPFSPSFLKDSGFHLLFQAPLQSFWEARHHVLIGQSQSMLSILVAYDLSLHCQYEPQDSCLVCQGRSTLFSQVMEQEPLITVDKSPSTRRRPGFRWSYYRWQYSREMRRTWILEDFPFMWPNTFLLLFKSVCSGFSVTCKVKTLNWFEYI